MNIPSDFSISSFNPTSEPQQPPEEAELDDIPEEDELHELLHQGQVEQQHQATDLNLPESEDIREAIEATKKERTERLVKAGVVIQHSVPKGFSLGFRSECEFPESPSKRYAAETGIDRSQFTDISFLPSSQGAQFLPSSPPMMATDSPSRKQATADDTADNPFMMEDDSGNGNPFDIQNDVQQGQDNPFNLEEATVDSRQQESIYDKAYNNPFSFETEENLDDIETPRLPPKSIISSKPLDKENRDPRSDDIMDGGMPFTLEDTTTTTTTSSLQFPQSTTLFTQQAISAPPPSSAPKPNQTSRVKVRFANGETTHLLQHPPSRLKIYRNSLVNQQHEQETETNPDLPRYQRKYYGVDIFQLKEAIKADAELAKAEAGRKAVEEAANKLSEQVEKIAITATKAERNGKKLLWTEKYRAKRFTDLLGDERTHRHILRWLKGWDTTVFGAAVGKKNEKRTLLSEEQRSRKILLVTGPPGLGKTTMAHVLARQAGYEPLEINASDDRTASVVKNRIKDVVGTETVHMGDAKRGKPICVIIDEIDGVTGEGEGGFIKALVDLIEQDRRNSGDPAAEVTKKRGKKGSDRFRFLRPIIAVCNDLYAPSLKSLRPLSEVVYTKRPPLGLVLGRLKEIFDREDVEGDTDAIRRLVELEGGHGNVNSADFLAEWSGDVRGVIVAGEWICGRLKSAAARAKACKATNPTLFKQFEPTQGKSYRMTKKWVEEEFNNGGGLGANDGASSGGRGNGVREVVERVFLEEDSKTTYISSGSGSKQPQVLPGTSGKSRNVQRLRNLIEASGEFDKIMTDCFAKYPAHPFHDDPRLTKPNKAYDWIFMHDLLNSRVFGGNQEYELTPYLSTPLLGLHSLFATPAATSLKGRKVFGKKGGNAAAGDDDDSAAAPFSGAKADFEMREAQKATMSTLNQLLGTLPHSLVRGFKPIETVAYELAPWLIQIVQPKVNPVLVGGKDGPGVASVRRDVEKKMVERAVEVLAECNVGFEKLRLEGDAMGRGGGWVFRMEPPFDGLSTYKTFTQDAPTLTTRYAVRQVLDQELRKFIILQQEQIRQARFAAANPGVDIGLSAATRQKEREKEREQKKNAAAGVKRDFFGRIVADEEPDDNEAGSKNKKRKVATTEGTKIWCSFREGFSNAVKKPITWEELMSGL
ncbi:hypothetical protein TWF694_011660 [Orbilia ellipsospora]|uniref:AAA+ ATPase domain-containing protein n=1 Tax=Orbilia ellipsospora TaxID=2528407 RepID=A0AAV9X5X3_9PEZI